MWRWSALAGALAFVSLAMALPACGGGGGKARATATKTVAKTATKTVTTTATWTLTGTPSAEPTPTPPAATERPEPSDTPVSTPPPEPTSTPPPTVRTTVNAALGEFYVRPSPGTAPAGTVVFNLRNEGAIPHDFLVIKTDRAPDALPVDPATFTVRESEVDVVARYGEVAAGASAQLTVDLAAARYVLICNLASHYQAGARIGFTVQ